MKFVWDKKKAEENVKNHDGVTFNEAQEVFHDPKAIDEYDVEHSIDEDRYNIIGLSSRRLLTVVYTQNDKNVVRLISAWKSTRKERGKYETE